MKLLKSLKHMTCIVSTVCITSNILASTQPLEIKVNPYSIDGNISVQVQDHASLNYDNLKLYSLDGNKESYLDTLSKNDAFKWRDYKVDTEGKELYVKGYLEGSSINNDSSKLTFNTGLSYLSEPTTSIKWDVFSQV